MKNNNTRWLKESTITLNWYWALAGCTLLTLLIVGFGPYSADIIFAPDQGSDWYYWQLTNPTLLTRALVWGGYAAHQLSMWALIYIALQQRPNYSRSLRSINLAAIAINAIFILLHIAQTKYSYDGLAQDVSIRSSFYAVALMIFMIFIMENKRRGMLLGKTIHTFDSATDFLRRYHGYYFSWAIIYTFWYHPIEDTVGHLAGNFYTFMLLLQGSLFFTRYHTNRYWTVLLEVSFSIHGALVAYLMSQHEHFGAVLLLSGLGAFALTQMYGLNLSKQQRILVLTLTIAGIGGYAFVYPEAAATTPLMLLGRYIIIIAIAAIIWLALLVCRRYNRLTSH